MLDTTLARPDDHEVATRVARAAGELLIETRERLQARNADQHQLKDAGDTYAHRFIMEQLAEARPDDAVLSEEGRDDLTRLDHERVWIVDPLDGTREYSEGRADWAVHVALTVNGVPAAAAVALPGEDKVLSTVPAAEVPPPSDAAPKMVVSRTRPPAAALIVADAIGAELVHMGSAGAKTMAVVQGMADVYAHSGGQYEWDSCAPVAVAAAAGLHTSRCDGSPLRYNQPDVWLPDLLVCRPELAEAALDALGRAIRGEL